MLKFAGGHDVNCEGEAGFIIITNRLNNIINVTCVCPYPIYIGNWDSYAFFGQITPCCY